MKAIGQTKPKLSRAEISSRCRRKRRKAGKCYQCTQYAVPGKTLCVACAQKAAIIGRSNYLKIKYAVIYLHGDRCACCGEKDIRLLTLDHRDNNGQSERKGLSGIFYRELWRVGKKRKDIQVLCYNCNLGRARNGGICPHKAPMSWKAEEHPPVKKRVRVVMHPSSLKRRNNI